MACRLERSGSAAGCAQPRSVWLDLRLEGCKCAWCASTAASGPWPRGPDALVLLVLCTLLSPWAPAALLPWWLVSREPGMPKRSIMAARLW